MRHQHANPNVGVPAVGLPALKSGAHSRLLHVIRRSHDARMAGEPTRQRPMPPLARGRRSTLPERRFIVPYERRAAAIYSMPDQSAVELGLPPRLDRRAKRPPARERSASRPRRRAAVGEAPRALAVTACAEDPETPPLATSRQTLLGLGASPSPPHRNAPARHGPLPRAAYPRRSTRRFDANAQEAEARTRARGS
jgi:hypothetical protein